MILQSINPSVSDRKARHIIQLPGAVMVVADAVFVN